MNLWQTEIRITLRNGSVTYVHLDASVETLREVRQQLDRAAIMAAALTVPADQLKVAS